MQDAGCRVQSAGSVCVVACMCVVACVFVCVCICANTKNTVNLHRPFAVSMISLPLN